MSSPTVWCPSCGDEYVAGSQFCSECRVALVDVPPEPGAAGTGDTTVGSAPAGYVQLGAWPPLATAMIVRRLVDAGITPVTSWSSPDGTGLTPLAVPDAQLDFADAVLRELPIEDELPTGDLVSYVERIEARLTEIAVLLDELRSTDEFGGGLP